uniref:F-box domain-containing protein n=1 Tax=Panagrellus redivivus TaxID=6233 RepID=A0A7E4VS05_PANRE
MFGANHPNRTGSRFDPEEDPIYAPQHKGSHLRGFVDQIWLHCLTRVREVYSRQSDCPFPKERLSDLSEAMTAVVLKPHLTAEIYDRCFAKFHHISMRNHKELLHKVLRIALSSKFAFRRFLYSVNCNGAAHLIRHDVQLFHKNYPMDTLPYPKLMNPFLKFVSKVSVRMIEFNHSDDFVKRFDNIIDIRELSLTHDRKIGVKVFPKLANVFAKLTDFDIDAHTFLKLLRKTDIAFPNLERLKINANFDQINKIAATPERFPALEFLEVASKAYGDQMVKDFTFAETPFPTVEDIKINVYGNGDLGFSDPFDFNIVKRWIQKFPLLKKATINVMKFKRHFPREDYEPEQLLQDAFRSIDFGVDLDFTYIIGSVYNENITYQWKYRLPCPH